MDNMSPEDSALNELWEARFQHPLPVQGGQDVIIEILMKGGVSRQVIDRAIADEKVRRAQR